MNDQPKGGELIAGIGGFVLIISMFIFAWFGVGPFTGDAFDAMKDWTNIILVFTAFAGMALAMFGGDVMRVSSPLSAITAGAGAVSTLVILLNIIIPPADLDLKYGVFIGLISAVAIGYGGYRAMQEEGATFGDVGDRFGGGGGGGVGQDLGQPQHGQPPAQPQHYDQGAQGGRQAPPPPPPPPPPPAG